VQIATRERARREVDAREPTDATRIMEVEYCPTCTCPPEYCEYVSCTRLAAEKLDKVTLEQPESSAGKVDDDATATEATTATDEGGDGEKKKSSSSKKKKGNVKEVVITRLSRNRRKMITNVVGLEKFDVDLKEASKAFGKKFACGCSVTKGATGKDELDLQGDYSEKMGELIIKTYGLEESEVRYVDKSKF
jgi:density-regulated protein DRP1